MYFPCGPIDNIPSKTIAIIKPTLHQNNKKLITSQLKV